MECRVDSPRGHGHGILWLWDGRRELTKLHGNARGKISKGDESDRISRDSMERARSALRLYCSVIKAIHSVSTVREEFRIHRAQREPDSKLVEFSSCKISHGFCSSRRFSFFPALPLRSPTRLSLHRGCSVTFSPLWFVTGRKLGVFSSLRHQSSSKKHRSPAAWYLKRYYGFHYGVQSSASSHSSHLRL